MLEVSHLTLQLPTPSGLITPVNDVSFTVAKGKMHALVGESGSGKTLTALSILQLQPELASFDKKSAIYFEGCNLLNYTREQIGQVRGQHIAMIFQEPMSALNPVLSIGEQLSEVLVKKHQRKSIKKAAIELLDAVGIAEGARRLNDYPHQFSGGMKQRVMIAMSLAFEPALLIADEPTTALDVTIQAQLLALLKSLQKKYQLGILLITHDLGVVAQAADTVSVMYHSQIVENNTVKALFKAPKNKYTQQLLQSRCISSCKPHVAPSQPLLKVCDLKVHFPVQQGLFKREVARVKAVDGVSFTIFAGETVALVGESGSGKTTAGKAIMQLITPDAGEVKLNDLSLNQLSKKQLNQHRRDFQIIFQDPFSALNPRMTVEDIIFEALQAVEPTLQKKYATQQIISVLDMVGLASNSINRYPHQFSGGQRQRIAIARSLSVNPKLIICDEPTSALDVTIKDQILQLLKQLQEEHNIAYLLITHDLASVKQIAHHVLVMYLGRLVEEGSVSTVMQAPKHPYAQALLASTPSLLPEQKLAVVKGELPSPLNPPSGCHFHPRCPHVMPKCRNQSPDLRQYGHRQAIRCYLHEPDTSST